MRLAIDARLFGPRQHRGLGRYLSNLINQLAKQDKLNDYFLLINPKNSEQPENLPSNFHLVKAPWPVYGLAEQFFLPRLIVKLKVDLVHYPHFNVPWLTPRPYLVTVHDLIIHHFPFSRTSSLPKFLYFIKLSVYYAVIKRAVSRAAQVLTVSHSTAQDLISHYPKIKSKIAVIYLAPTPSQPTDLQVGYDYFLVVGAAYPHKNLERLILAYAAGNFANKNIKLLVVGREDFFTNRLKKLIKDKNLDSAVIFWGPASEGDLAALYSQATAYVLPSLWEGFGFGPLEALAYHKPVVVSALPVLKEILGQAPIYFNPQQVEDIKNKLQEALDKPIAKVFSPATLPRIYDWSITGQQVLAIYQSFKTRLQVE
ncbi:glycosyltransferase family 4 protein [Patescibacteria group bacterium]|nr:glycosyltransferase family 4 protein [Patescibacteria group bacterium]